MITQWREDFEARFATPKSACFGKNVGMDNSGAGNVGGGGKTSGGKSNASGGNSSASTQRAKDILASPSKVVAGTETPQASVNRINPNFGSETAQQVAGKQASAGKTQSEDGLPPVVSANPNNAETINLERAGTNYGGPGATPYIGDPSLGQVLGALLNISPIAGTMNNAAGVANNLTSDDGFGFDKPYDGGAFGQAIDKLRGVSPGGVTGSTNPDVGGNKAKGTIVQPLQRGTPGRAVNGDDTPVAAGLQSMLSASGTWPPIKPSAAVA